MGGRGSSSGMSVKERLYGTEYYTVYKLGNVKFVKMSSGAATAPLETMTEGRVYVTIGSLNELKCITYYDKHNKRAKQVDLTHTHAVNEKLIQPHTHKGYFHDEKGGTHPVTEKERKMIERITKAWQYHLESN